MRSDGQAPQYVAKLLDEPVSIDLSSLKHFLPHQPENFGGFFG